MYFDFFGSYAYWNITSIIISKSQMKTLIGLVVVEGKSLKKICYALNYRKVTDLSKSI